MGVINEVPEFIEDSPKLRNFDWEKAKTFYYVAKSGSFASAARSLNIAQSALSRQIIFLEQQIGCPLFSRHSTGVTMTRKGKELFEIVETMFIKFKVFTKNTHSLIDDGKRKIRIATTHAISSYILDSLILEYNDLNPHLVFELISEDRAIDLVLNDVDIAIRPVDKLSEQIHQEYLFSLEKKLYASKDYIKVYGEPLKEEDLIKHKIIAPAHPREYPYSRLTWILSLGMPKGKYHKPVFTANSIESLVKAAQKSKGIIGGYEKMEIIKNSKLVNILPHVKEGVIDLFFITPDYLKKDIEVTNLRKFLKKSLKNK